jgi:hypothetical protein
MLTRQELADQAASLAVQGVHIGTSSWKYPGWCGMLYDRARYEYRGKFAETQFKRDCLAEYAEVFKTVCVDAAYYTFPSQQHLEGMVTQAPDDFLFGLKIGYSSRLLECYTVSCAFGSLTAVSATIAPDK